MCFIEHRVRETYRPATKATSIRDSVLASTSPYDCHHGLITRALPNGDALGFSPPLIVSKDEIDQIVQILERAIQEVSDELTRENVSIG